MKNRNVLVGSFVVAGLVLFTLALFLIGSSQRAFTRHFEVYTEFANLGGLTTGTKVQVGGFSAGEVTEIDVPRSVSSKFRLKLKLEQSVRPLVRTDSVATIVTQGVVGDKILMIQPGSNRAPEVSSSGTLPSKEALDLSVLVERSAGLLNDVSGTMKVVSGKLNGTLDAVTATVNNANDVVTALKQGKGTAGLLLSDRATAEDVRQAVVNVRQTTASLNHAAAQGDSLVTDLQSRQFGQKADQAMASVQSTVSRLDQTSQQVHDAVSSALAPDARGMDAGTNIRQSLSSMAIATGNLEEDTEAVKHGFFFRGFFKHRGYYSLARLEPKKYRADKVFANSSNQRVWLNAEIFQTLPNGKEILSEAGKQQINGAVVQLGDAALVGAVVVEGYSDRGDAADQLAASQARSILVRQYLHNHFQIDMQNVGAVPLRGTPPPSTGKEHWNGVCLVLLKPKH